ncbi:Hexose transporter 2 [Wickerhamomyces ciferrii]|uniref:Hexose transporter 2 n=1 Tax=Wickerhamomyces ciferrii (strain ATCC 14091 / BCRC 22168 / CBS 111 / JCM 3599 / NBRC 0793 / NRRL Y-1031 F-60-10) TaxID=1206466 RepID=K0KKV7_WICCF|nr:Hexose transporter 2 [Wickerhamomyces ciferrii]CCH45845.1 Hexose transporter 2 [Wickerhamomyces ciferrii]
MSFSEKYNGLADEKASVPADLSSTEQAFAAHADEEPIYHSFLGMSGKKLSTVVSTVAGVGFLLFGYDQGLMGSLLTLEPFRETFPEIDVVDDPSKSTYQGFVIAVYEIGCLAGALFTMWFGDKVGRRKTIFVGCWIMIVGAIIQTASYSTAQLLVGRIVAGVGNGMNTSTVPVWQSECAKPDKRGKLVMVEGALITGGITIAYWVDFAFYFLRHESSASWRFPVAFQIFFPVLIIPIILRLPESPRWLLKVGRTEDAIRVFSALEGIPHNDDYIKHEVQEVQTALAKEVSDGAKNGFQQLFKMGPGRTFHRVSLAFWNQVMQQITGINLITYYAGTVFEVYIGMTAFNSRILAACNGTEYFLASWVAYFFIERVGRRKLMLFGAAGQAGTMAILTGTNWAANHGNSSAGIAAAVFLFVFNTFFAIGWLGMTWLYPAEIAPLHVRAATNGLSTAANWSFNFMVVMITPVAFANIGVYTYTIFAVINLLMIPVVYFLYPETAGRTLEEMDIIFENSDPRRPWDVVHQAKILPFGYSHGKFAEDIEKATASHEENTGIFQK